ncbi:MAG: MIP/aquaporin family protein [Bacteroidota bacterium]
MQAIIAEFIGTFILILLGNGVVANVILRETKGFNSGPLVIFLGWGMAVFIAVAIVGPYSGAHLNPAVSIGLAVAGAFDWAQVPAYVLAQMAGAMTGAGFVWLMYKDHYGRTEDQGVKLATFSTGPAIRNIPSNVFSEILGTFVLVFAALYSVGADLTLADGTSGTIGLGTLGALPAGLVVFSIGMSLGGTTGYAINPARDLGPRIMHAILPISAKGDSDWSYAWVPVIGPILGGILAAGLYFLLGS